MSNDRLEPFNYHNIAFKRCADVVSLRRLLQNYIEIGPVISDKKIFKVFYIDREFLISVQTGYFFGFPEPWVKLSKNVTSCVWRVIF